MKDHADNYTLDVFDAPRRGRPRKPGAKTSAQRVREFRARQKAKGQGFNFLINVTGNGK